MVVVAMVSAIAVVLVLVKVPVCPAAINNMEVVVEVLVANVSALIDVGFIVVAAIAIVLKFGLTVSYSEDVSSDLFMDALADVMPRVLTGISIEVLVDVNANAFEVVTALAFTVSTTLEGFSR